MRRCLVVWLAVVACGGSGTAIPDGALVDGQPADSQPAALVAIQLAGPTRVHVADHVALVANGIYSDGSVVDVSATAAWSTSAVVATVVSGQVTGMATGSVSITASIGTLSDSMELRVLAPHVLVIPGVSIPQIAFVDPLASGNAAPLRVISMAAAPAAVAVVDDEVFAITANAVLVYAITQSGNVAPIRQFTCAALAAGSAITVSHDEIYVGTNDAGPILVFPIGANGSLVQPTRTIDTGHGRNQPGQVVGDELYVSGLATYSIEVYPRTASGSVTPIRTLAGPTTGLYLPAPPYLTDTELFVANHSTGLLSVFPKDASGDDTAPSRTLSLANGNALDGTPAVHDDVMFIPDSHGPFEIGVFDVNASGNTAPLRAITGSATMLGGPYGVYYY